MVQSFEGSRSAAPPHPVSFPLSAGPKPPSPPQWRRRREARWRARRVSRDRSHEIQFAANVGLVDGGEAAGQQGFPWIGVSGDDAIELALAGAEVIADDLAEDRSKIDGAGQVAVGHPKHGAGRAGDP